MGNLLSKGFEYQTGICAMQNAWHGVHVNNSAEMRRIVKKKTVDVIIPAYKPGEEFRELLARLLKQTVMPEHIFILQTVEDGEELLKFEEDCIKVFPIQKAEFDHGGTRDYGARLSGADYILFMTQDAMPKNEGLIEELLKGVTINHVGMAYGRQLARKDADITEQLARQYNYPPESRLKTRADLENLGIKTYFCSDVCAMYDRNLYLELGGFVHPTIFNEGTIIASRMIQAGYGVYYAAEAKVIHSHSYTCMQQFRRNFDLGVSQKEYSEVFENISSEKEGAGFAKKTILVLCGRLHFFKAFYFAWQCAFRLFGYKMGKNYDRLPKRMVLWCTMSPSYWSREE